MTKEINIPQRSSKSSKFGGKRRALLCVAVSGILVAVIMIVSAAFFSGSTANDGSSTDTASSSTGAHSSNMEVLSTFTATSDSSESARSENIALAAQAINGKKLSKGSQFSFNEAVGDVSVNSKYQSESAAEDSNAIDAHHAGVSQVSSALYVAAIEAGLEISERHPNTVAQEYSPLGLDAAVSYGDLDLVFVNSTRNPIVIEASSSGSAVTVTIYGTPDSSGQTYKASSSLIDKVETVAGDASTTQYIVNTFRLMYKDGAAIQRDLLYTDVYYGSVLSNPEARTIAI